MKFTSDTTGDVCNHARRSLNFLCVRVILCISVCVCVRACSHSLFRSLSLQNHPSPKPSLTHSLSLYIYISSISAWCVSEMNVFLVSSCALACVHMCVLADQGSVLQQVHRKGEQSHAARFHGRLQQHCRTGERETGRESSASPPGMCVWLRLWVYEQRSFVCDLEVIPKHVYWCDDSVGEWMTSSSPASRCIRRTTASIGSVVS